MQLSTHEDSCSPKQVIVLDLDVNTPQVKFSKAQITWEQLLQRTQLRGLTFRFVSA